jgi:hypothetical protein
MTSRWQMGENLASGADQGMNLGWRLGQRGIESEPQYSEQAGTEDEASDHRGCNAGYEHCASGNIQATFDPGLAFRIQTMKECLDGAVE